MKKNEKGAETNLIHSRPYFMDEQDHFDKYLLGYC